MLVKALLSLVSSDMVVAVVGALRLIVVPVKVIVVALIAPLTFTVVPDSAIVLALRVPVAPTVTVGAVKVMPASELTGALTSIEGDVIGVVLATSDALFKVIGAPIVMLPLASVNVVAAPPAATVSGALTPRLIDEASDTLPAARRLATRAAVIWLAAPPKSLASRVLPGRSSPVVPSPLTLAIVPMSRSTGRAANGPPRHCGAPRSAPPWKSSVCLPETSALPPLPPAAPPRACKLPGVARVVVGPDHDVAAIALRRRTGIEHDTAADIRF